MRRIQTFCDRCKGELTPELTPEAADEVRAKYAALFTYFKPEVDLCTSCAERLAKVW